MSTLIVDGSEEKKEILEPYRYVLNFKSLDLSQLIFEFFNHWLNIPNDKYKLFNDFLNKFFHATMLIDDIEDRAALRRGNPVANRVFGMKSTYNCANYIYFVELKKMLDHLPESIAADALKIYSANVLEMWKGLGLDIYYRDSMHCPTEAQYIAMAQKKAAYFVIMFVQMLQLFSDDKRDYKHLIIQFLTYIQIRDDYLNLTSSEYAKKKGFCEDLTEGKFSFPLVHAINSNSEKIALLHILKQRTEDETLKKYVIKQLQVSGTFEYTLKRIGQLYGEILEEIRGFGGNAKFEQFMQSTLDLEKQSVF